MTADPSTALRAPSLEDCRIVELRDYLLHPGQRDVLVELFDREFVETQEAAGMRVAGTFTDLDRPDHFVWLRGFADGEARKAGLEAFYDGPVWAAHRDAANATMIDASDVRLLRYARPTWALVTPALPRPRPSVRAAVPATVFHIDLCTLRAPVDAAWRRWFEREALPLLVDVGATPCAVFETEPMANDFPRLPVRSGEYVFAWLSRHADEAAAARATQSLAASARWNDEVLPRLLRASAAPMQLLRLCPSARSLLR
ncbi:MAG: NIPSNAP family protein [Burkholderiales bacterium]|nr:NIPSNAP family protein [Burkholderiales bacterium]